MLYYHLKRCNIKRTTCVKDTAAGVAAVTGILSVFCTPTTESTAIDTSTALVAANQASANILRDVANVASCHCKRQKKTGQTKNVGRPTGQVAYGTLLKIITDIEAEYRLDTGTMQPVKICSNRVRRNNLTGSNQNKTSPFFTLSRCLPQFASNWNESEHHSPRQI